MNQPSVWWDFTKDLEVGLECSDPSLTFDGHYIAIFPKSSGETDSSGAIKRAEQAIEFMTGKRQMKRN